MQEHYLSPIFFAIFSVLALSLSVHGQPSNTLLEPPTPVRRTAATATPNFTQLQLDPSFVISSTPTTRTFNWVISNVTGSPDGYQRPVLAVNNQFPGPLIEANTGDTIVVNVQNDLNEGTSIHWHGLNQNQSVYMDGLVGITQCPIPAGGSFTYQFTIENQFGTFWWHSHYSVQYTDGLQGPLIVHSPNDPLKINQDFDEEQVIILDDWWHEPAEQIFVGLNTVGYDGVKYASPSPDSVLINGVGNCGPGSDCVQVAPAEIYVTPGQKTRLRLINTGSHAQQRFSVDDHPLSVVEADETPITALTGQHRIPIHNGQRYSVIVDATVGENGDAYWIRSSLVETCLPYTGSDLNGTGIAILRYVDSGSTPSTTTPTSQDWSDPSTTGDCVDFEPYQLVPAVSQNVPTTSKQYARFDTQVSSSGTAFNVNNVSFTNHPFEPLLETVYSGGTTPTNVAMQTFNSVTVADIIINNIDDAWAFTHPVHLHGRSFWIVATGSGVLTEQQAPSIAVNVDNPILRDTLVLPPQTWAMLRIITDVPGVWGMHCHIAWHLADGFLGALIIQPTTIQALTPPSGWSQLCSDGSPNAIIPGLGPGEGSLDSNMLEAKALHVEPPHWSRRNHKNADRARGRQEGLLA